MKAKAKSRRSGGPVAFRIFIDPRTSPQYFEVLIYRDWKSLQRARRRKDNGCEAFYRPDSADRIVTFINRHEHNHGNPRIGTLNFYPGSLTVGIVTHELFHAVTNWARQMGCVPGWDCNEEIRHSLRHGKPDHEEVCAEVIGSLAAQFFVALGGSGMKLKLDSKIALRDYTGV